ncbi:MAG TPA: SEC-C metal-binding domain-containing protein, partial [Patescibacteria group bacterium]|nr:SEC-C metal-binding domain-containing protein [Patescibacteria group bacterium]
EKAANYGPDIMRMVEKSLLLQVLDQSWKDHLLTLDHLRQGIGLRAYGQRDPLNEYKQEAFNLFGEMLALLREKITALLAHIELRMDDAPTEDAFAPRPQSGVVESREDPAFAERRAAAAAEAGLVLQQPTRTAPIDLNDPATWGSTSRNAPCPCGSGKKYKHCHGAAVA